MPQRRRRALIVDLLREDRILNQDALADALDALGEPATQTTISRDLAALRVVKGHDGYHLPADHPPALTNGRLDTTIRGHGVEVHAAHSLVVIRTAPGHAGLVGDELDHAPPDGCLGTIAGDDTVFIATASPATAKRLARELGAALETTGAGR